MKLPLLLSLSESARLFGVSQRTLRRAISKDELKHTVINGRYKISFPDLITWSESESRYVKKRDKDGIGRYVSSWKSPEEITEDVAPIPQTHSEPTPFPSAQKPNPAASPAATPPEPEPEERTLHWD